MIIKILMAILLWWFLASILNEIINTPLWNKIKELNKRINQLKSKHEATVDKLEKQTCLIAKGSVYINNNYLNPESRHIYINMSEISSIEQYKVSEYGDIEYRIILKNKTTYNLMSLDAKTYSFIKDFLNDFKELKYS